MSEFISQNPVDDQALGQRNLNTSSASSAFHCLFSDKILFLTAYLAAYAILIVVVDVCLLVSHNGEVVQFLLLHC